MNACAMLAAEDMLQWTRYCYYGFADHSTGHDGDEKGGALDASGKADRDHRKLVRLTAQREYFG
jgi:hypothetical protein